MQRALLLFTVLIILAGGAFGQKVHIPPTSRHTLENGLTVILMEYRKVPVVCLRLVTRGGSAQDPEGLEGVASLTTALMREGTVTRTSSEIADAIDFIGGSLSVSAGLEYCAANAEVLAKDLDTGLNLFADVILHPSFPDEEIERQRKQYLASLDAVKENPGSIASISFRRNVYGAHPYGRQSFGTKSSLERMVTKDIRDFYARVFVPDNATLVVVGDFHEAEMLEKVRSTFGAWPRGGMVELALSPPSIVQGRKVVLVDKPDATQTQIRVGNIGVDIKHPDYVAIAVANTIFGGGFTSRLNDELRVKRSLTYGAGSGFTAYLAGGTYSISTFTKNETIRETIDVILEELRKFRDKGATRDEWKKAHNYMAGEFARSLQTPEALAARMTDIELYGFPKDHLETYIKRINAVSLADVQRVAQKYFLLDDLLFVLVTPAQHTAAGMEPYGPVSVVELKDVVQ
jgi:predicted Zn-dependent peptidase